MPTSGLAPGRKGREGRGMLLAFYVTGTGITRGTTMQHTLDPELVRQGWNLLQLVAVAALAGWTAERLLDTGVRSRGLPFLSGLFGLYIGPQMLAMTGCPTGPIVAGQPLLAAFAGAMAIGAFLKLASLGAPGTR
jgi:hypothetical protein